MWYLINDRVVKYHFPASDNNIQALSGFFHDKIHSCYYKHVLHTVWFYLFASAFFFYQLFNLVLAFIYRGILLTHGTSFFTAIIF